MRNTRAWLCGCTRYARCGRRLTLRSAASEQASERVVRLDIVIPLDCTPKLAHVVCCALCCARTMRAGVCKTHSQIRTLLRRRRRRQHRRRSLRGVDAQSVRCAKLNYDARVLHTTAPPTTTTPQHNGVIIFCRVAAWRKHSAGKPRKSSHDASTLGR